MFDRLMFRPLELRLVLWLLVLLVLSLSGLLWNAAAHGATVAGTLTHATKYEDGTDLGANLKHSKVEVGNCTTQGTFNSKEGEALVVPPATSWTVTVARAWGDFCARAVTETVSGQLSVFTGTVKVTKVEPKPRPPVLATPTVAAVYELIPDKWDGVRLGRNVGTVPAGTGCDPNREPILGWYDVKDHSQIKFTKNKPKSDVLVAQCRWRG
jgi:hypothetical protein